MTPNDDIDRIEEIIHSRPLASAIYQSIEKGVVHKFVHLNGKTVWKVFKGSLDSAISDIESHERGKLFLRLLEYGPPNPDDPEKLTSDGETVLSDPECGQCVQFIFSHMVNRFKGELAELLTIEPCMQLLNQLQEAGSIPVSADLYFGDTVREQRRIKKRNSVQWGGYTKGADGLIAKYRQLGTGKKEIQIHGVIEVKSMPRSKGKLLSQINQHVDRLRGGVKLDTLDWEQDQVVIDNPVSIMVVPSIWKVSREWQRKETATGWSLVVPEPTEPPNSTRIEEIGPSQWVITLNWSKEALEQAAYEMTFWYMSQVGSVIYQTKPLPKEWEEMTPEEAGYNSIKMMLYYLILRYISPYQGYRAIKLYNAYSFGYPFAVDAKDMLWPEDFSVSKKP